ncbi:uncharacterized protein METZ01_LOCUS259734, partial [marine metagenome]
MRILNLPDGAQEGGGDAMQVSDEDVQAIAALQEQNKGMR